MSLDISPSSGPRGNWADSAWNLERADAMRYLSDVFTYLARIARVSYTHTLGQLREHVDTVLGYLIAPVFHRPRHCLSCSPAPSSPESRSPRRPGPTAGFNDA